MSVIETQKQRQLLDVTASSICTFPGLILSDDAVVFVAGAYSGRELDFQIDNSGYNAFQFDVVVNNTKTPVILMLGAYNPAIWNIRWTHGTRIAAVVVSGYYHQALAGLDDATPTLVTTYTNRHSCGYFYVTADQAGSFDDFSHMLFKRPIQAVSLAKEGDLLIGDPPPEGVELLSSPSVSPEMYHDRYASLAGSAGLEDAVEEGFLRIATSTDAQAWVEAIVSSPESDFSRDYGFPIDFASPEGKNISRPRSPSIENAYVVLKPWTFPPGLDASAPVFFIPEGTPKPSGDPGHSAIYDFNTLRCQGISCRPY